MNIKESSQKLLVRRSLNSVSAMKLHTAISIVIIAIILSASLNLSYVLSLLTNNTSIGSSGKIVTISPLHVEGRHIKNSFNTTVLLRGFNQPGMLDHPNGLWNPEGGGLYSGFSVWSPEAVKYNLDCMRSWGSNLLRLHTRIAWWLNDSSNYRQHLKDIITWAGERGIYVVFEPYCISSEKAYGFPWAPWATESEDQAVMPDRQAFIDYWISVANELKDYPNVIFEIYNEPQQPSLEISYEDSATLWFETVQLWIDAVRAAGADQLLVVQWWVSQWINLDSPSAGRTLAWVEEYSLSDSLGNIVYSSHIYRDSVHKTVPTRINCWEYADMKKGFELMLFDYVVNILNKPLIVGEIGANMWEADEGLVQELAFFNNSLTIFDELGVNYAVWLWDCPAHMRHGILQNGYPWLPPLNDAGEVVVSRIA